MIPMPEEELKFRNHYHCDDCDEEWQDEWSCMCNDRCPSCNKEIEPYESVDLNYDDKADYEQP